MTRRKERLPLETTSVRLFRGDLDRLVELYPKVEPSRVIREIIHNHVLSIDAAARSATPAPRIDINV